MCVSPITLKNPDSEKFLSLTTAACENEKRWAGPLQLTEGNHTGCYLSGKVYCKNLPHYLYSLISYKHSMSNVSSQGILTFSAPHVQTELGGAGLRYYVPYNGSSLQETLKLKSVFSQGTFKRLHSSLWEIFFYLCSYLNCICLFLRTGPSEQEYLFK